MASEPNKRDDDHVSIANQQDTERSVETEESEDIDELEDKHLLKDDPLDTKIEPEDSATVEEIPTKILDPPKKIQSDDSADKQTTQPFDVSVKKSSQLINSPVKKITQPVDSPSANSSSLIDSPTRAKSSSLVDSPTGSESDVPTESKKSKASESSPDREHDKLTAWSPSQSAKRKNIKQARDDSSEEEEIVISKAKRAAKRKNIKKARDVSSEEMEIVISKAKRAAKRKNVKKAWDDTSEEEEIVISKTKRAAKRKNVKKAWDESSEEEEIVISKAKKTARPKSAGQRVEDPYDKYKILIVSAAPQMKPEQKIATQEIEDSSAKKKIQQAPKKRAVYSDDKEKHSGDSWSDEDSPDDGTENDAVDSSPEEKQSQPNESSLSKDELGLESGSPSPASTKSVEVNILEDLEFLKALDNSIADVVIPPEKKRKEKSLKSDTSKKKRRRNSKSTPFSGPDSLENVLKQLEALEKQDEESPAVPDDKVEKKTDKSTTKAIEEASEHSSEQGTPKKEETISPKRKRKKSKDKKRSSAKKKRKKHKTKGYVGTDNLEDVLKELERLEKEDGDRDTGVIEQNDDSSDDHLWEKLRENSVEQGKEKSMTDSIVVSSNNTSPKQSSDWFDSKSLSAVTTQDDAFQAMFKLHYGKQKEKLHKQQKRARQKSSEKKKKSKIESSMPKREIATKSPPSTEHKRTSRVMISASQKDYIHRQRQYKRTRRKMEQKKHENDALTFKPAINNRKMGFKRDGFLKEVEKDMQRRSHTMEQKLKERQEQESELFRPRINKDDSVMQFGDVFNRLFLKGKAKQATKEKKRKKPKFSKAARRRMRVMVEKMHSEAQRKRDRQRSLVLMRNARENARVNAPKISAGSIRYIRNRLVRFVNKACMAVLDMPVDMEFEELELSYEQLIRLFRVLGFYERKDVEETECLNPEELQINDRLLQLMDPTSSGKVTYIALVNILNQFVGSGNTPESPSTSMCNAADGKPWRPAGRIVNCKRLSVPKVRISRDGLQQKVDSTIAIDASLRKAIQSLTTNQLSMNPISEITKDRVGSADVYPEPEPQPKRVFINLKKFERKWRSKTMAWKARKNKWVKWKEAKEVARAKNWPFKPTIISQNSEYYSYDETRRKTFGRLYKDAVNRRSKKQRMMQKNETAMQKKLQKTCPFNPQLVSKVRPKRTSHLPAGFANAVKRMQSRKLLLQESMNKMKPKVWKRKLQRRTFTPDSSPSCRLKLEDAEKKLNLPKPEKDLMQTVSQKDGKQIINVDLVEEIVKAVPYNTKEEEPLAKPEAANEDIVHKDEEDSKTISLQKAHPQSVPSDSLTKTEESFASETDDAIIQRHKDIIEVEDEGTPRRTRTRVTFNEKMEYFVPPHGSGDSSNDLAKFLGNYDGEPPEFEDAGVIDLEQTQTITDMEKKPVNENSSRPHLNASLALPLEMGFVDQGANADEPEPTFEEQFHTTSLGGPSLEEQLQSSYLGTPEMNPKNIAKYFEDSSYIKPTDLDKYFEDTPEPKNTNIAKYLRDSPETPEMTPGSVAKYFADTPDIYQTSGETYFEGTPELRPSVLRKSFDESPEKTLTASSKGENGTPEKPTSVANYFEESPDLEEKPYLSALRNNQINEYDGQDLGKN